MCYTCSPASPPKKPKEKDVSSPKPVNLLKLLKPEPISYEEIRGARYTVKVTPWSKLRPSEIHRFDSRNAAEKSVAMFRSFGEHVELLIHLPEQSGDLSIKQTDSVTAGITHQ